MFDKICLAEKAMNFQTFFLMLSELWITDALMHRWGPYSSLVRFTELHCSALRLTVQCGKWSFGEWIWVNTVKRIMGEGNIGRTSGSFCRGPKKLHHFLFHPQYFRKTHDFVA